MAQVPEAQEQHNPDVGQSRSSPDIKSVESNVEAEKFVTTRYRHEVDEHGNHLVIGREGEVRRCEDEVCIP